eukprot:6001799-Amphidinium_carterae.1
MKFRMVAEHIVHLREGPPHCREQRVAERAQRELLPCQYRVNSALLVKHTYQDPTSGSTTTWSTLPEETTITQERITSGVRRKQTA